MTDSAAGDETRSVTHDTLKCPVCESEELSPETSYASFEHHARFTGLGGEGIFGGIKDLTVSPSRARICLSCGFLMLFVSSSDQGKIKDAIGA